MKWMQLLVVWAVAGGLVIAQETETKNEDEGGGGLFGRLKKLVPEDTSKLKEKLGSVLEDSVDGIDSFLKSGTEANEMMESMLAYLDKKLAGREPAYTPEEIQAYADKLAPIVAELSGREFDGAVEVKPVGNIQMIQIMARDLAPQFALRMPDTPKPMIYLRAYLASGMIAPSLLGKYGVEDHTVYVLPQNIEVVMENLEIDSKYRDQIVQIVIGHELAHKLQDQEVNLLEATLATESPDASSAFNATIEGHAVFIQNLLADKLGFDEAAKEASSLFVAGDLEDDAWIYERLAHAEAVMYEQIYLGGERFISHHHKEGGDERIWNIMANPPKRSSMITQPATYTTDPPPVPDFQSKFAFARAAAGLNKEDWGYAAEAIGDFDLRAWIADVDRAERETIMRGLESAAAILMPSKMSFSKNVDLTLFEFRTEKEAILMAEALDRMTAQQIDDLESNGMVRVKDEERGPYSAMIAKGVSRQYTVEEFLLGESEVTDIIIRRGTQVANLVECGSGMTKEQADELMLGALRRMNLP